VRAHNAVADDPTLVPAPHGGRIQAEVKSIKEILQQLRLLNESDENQEPNALRDRIRLIVKAIVSNDEAQASLLEYIENHVLTPDVNSLSEFLSILQASDEKTETEIERGKINILTMHKAKGLTAEAVIIVAAEDEYLPGRAQDEGRGDEQRLLYVSLTRAKHFLYLTYCHRRTGPQQYTGRASGSTQRVLSRFLQDAPVSPRDGESYVQRLLSG
jgi:DNA helicase-2/ATP-dependent DNA helicase PcrA